MLPLLRSFQGPVASAEHHPALTAAPCPAISMIDDPQRASGLFVKARYFLSGIAREGLTKHNTCVEEFQNMAHSPYRGTLAGFVEASLVNALRHRDDLGYTDAGRGQPSLLPVF